MTSLTLALTAPASADATIIFAAQSGRTGVQLLSHIGTPAAEKKAVEALKQLNFAAKAGELAVLPAAVAATATKLVVVGVGSDAHHETFRQSAGVAARSLHGHRKASVLIPHDSQNVVGAVAEGMLLGAYTFNPYRNKTASTQRDGLRSCVLVTDAAKEPVAKKAVARAIAISDAVNRTRDLANTPPNHLPPAGLAAAAAALAEDNAIEIEILDEKQLAKRGFGGIVAVGQGSKNPPRLVRMAYRPAGATAHLSIVGKGITFDTGGISLKPPKDMHEMTADMSGAAAVINAIVAISQLGIKVNVTAYAACAENMPGGNAQRPGDVITAYGGRTVEVLNTDAEGRLVLMDALVRAQEDKPDFVIDVATLTGAAVIALGFRISSVFSPQDGLRNHVVDAATRSGEAMWPMPIVDEYHSRIESTIADIRNIGDPQGSSIYGALFLKDFIEPGQKWAHLDIAAPAYNARAPYGYSPRGATGAGVRTLVTVAEDIAAGLLRP